MITFMGEPSLLQTKRANTNFAMLKEIAERWSPRVFASHLLTKGEINMLFEAARWAASSRNEQPWAFIIAQKGDEHYNMLFDCLNDWNQKWANTAPLIGIALAKSHFDFNNAPNAHAKFDLGMAMANLAIQANHMNLFVHQMGGFYPEKVLESFDVPNTFEPVVAFAVGYFDETLVQELPAALQSSEKEKRARKPCASFVFGNKFGLTSNQIMPFEVENN